jgi:DNA mismatch repair ATPase MutS
MTQAGLFVTARSMRASVCTQVFTHFIREEDTEMISGRLDEELKRMSVIADQVSPHSIVLFNESFAATNEREGSARCDICYRIGGWLDEPPPTRPATAVPS